jgi:undecaprenyl-diphosphatase
MPEWIQHIDDQVLVWFRAEHTKWLDINVKNITVLGSTTVLAIFGVIALGALLLCGQYKKAFLVIVLVIGTYYATDGIKSAVGRHRPPDVKKKSASFPSGHSSRSMSVFGILALCLRNRGQRGLRRVIFVYALLWAFLLAGAVGVSRLYLGDHYLSDVVAGLLLGLAVMLAFYLADRYTEFEK